MWLSISASLIVTLMLASVRQSVVETTEVIRAQFVRCRHSNKICCRSNEDWCRSFTLAGVTASSHMWDSLDGLDITTFSSFVNITSQTGSELLFTITNRLTPDTTARLACYYPTSICGLSWTSFSMGQIRFAIIPTNHIRFFSNSKRIKSFYLGTQCKWRLREVQLERHSFGFKLHVSKHFIRDKIQF